MEALTQGIRQRIFRELMNATSSIDIAMCYFNDSALLRLLSMKAFSGVDVSIILDNNQIVAEFGDKLQQAADLGCQIFICKHTKLMHSKFIVIDRTLAITGSYNLTNAAPVNIENVVLFNCDSKVLSTFDQAIKQCMKMSEIIEPNELSENNTYLTPLMKKQNGLESSEPKFGVWRTDENFRLIVDYPWNPMRNDVFECHHLNCQSADNQIMVKVLQKYPHLIFELNSCSFGIVMDCCFCGKQFIAGWLDVRKTRCPCRKDAGQPTHVIWPIENKFVFLGNVNM